MAAIDQYLRHILEATYGEEVRHSIHDAIKQNYMDVSDSVAQANQAADAAENALAKANQATANVNAVVDRANAASSTANAASSTANSASERATSAAARVETIERKYTNATAQASSLAPGATPTATLEDGTNGKIFKFGIPKGEKGNTGATPQMSIGTVTKGTNAAASMTGTAEKPVLNLTLPKGDTGATPQLSIGNVAKGENAGATITGTAEAPVLNLTLPKGDTGGKGDKGQKGDTGATPQLSIGTVTKSATAGATITGTAEAPVLNLNLPKGDTGATPQLGVGTVETGLPGSRVEVTISGTAEAPNLNFKIPKGDTGVAENIYGNTVQMSEADSTTVADAIGSKANASETYTKTQVDAMIAGATDADAVHSVNGKTATDHAVTVYAEDVSMSGSDSTNIPNKLKQYVKTVNGTAPDPITGNVTVATGGGDSTVGLIRRIIGIAVSDWTGSGPFTYTYQDADIKVGMVVLEEYLSDEYAQLGVNTYTIQNGSLTIATTVKPTADWSLTVVLGMDGSSILDDVGALQTKVGTSQLTTTAQNLSDAVNELDLDISGQATQIGNLNSALSGDTALRNVDLNDYKTTGAWVIGNIQNITNAPAISLVGYYGTLYVRKNYGFVKQIFIGTIGSAIRQSDDSGSSWHAWIAYGSAPLQSGLAIVTDGDTHAAITKGQYVYIKKHTSLAEGLYTTNENIESNGALSGKVTAASGVLNTLKSNIDALNSNPVISLINKTDADSGITIQAFANGSSVTVAFLRESTGTEQSDWYVLAELPIGYRPFYTITSYFIHGDAASVDRLRINTNGLIRLFAPKTGQMGGVVTFSI